MTRCFIASSTSSPSPIAARRTSTGRSSSRVVVAAPRSLPRRVAVVAVRASNDQDQDSSSSPPSMFRRLALALGVASAAGGASAGTARAAEAIPADLPQSEEEWKSKLSSEAFYVLRKVRSSSSGGE